MIKRRPMGQDPLSWIKNTGEVESAEPRPEDAESQGIPDSPPPLPGEAPPAPRPGLPFMLIITVDFLLLIILGYLGYALLDNQMGDLRRRVEKLESTDQRLVDEGRGLRDSAVGEPAPAVPAPSAPRKQRAVN